MRESPQHWWVTFTLELPDLEPITVSSTVVGINVGLTAFIATSDPVGITLGDGETVVNPRFFRKDEADFAHNQRRLSREKKGTPKYRNRRKTVAIIHRRIRNRRNNFMYQLSRRLWTATN